MGLLNEVGTLNAPPMELGILDLITRLVVSLVLGFILSFIGRRYTPKYSQGSVSILIGLLTFIGASLVILIGGSLVLTLGIMGGLNVVRFRTSIKEPVDIAFIFISMIVGVGAGAGMVVQAGIITIIFCIAFIWYGTLIKRKDILMVDIEVYADNYKELTDLLNSYKGVIIHKKRDGKTKDGFDTVCVEFEVMNTTKSKALLSTKYLVQI
jgi:hypothetical protein